MAGYAPGPGQAMPQKEDMGLPATVLKTLPSDSESDVISQDSPGLDKAKDSTSLRTSREEVDEKQGGVAAEAKEEARMDGGLDAWLQVVGCFCLYINTWGIINSFGVFQVCLYLDRTGQRARTVMTDAVNADVLRQ